MTHAYRTTCPCDACTSIRMSPVHPSVRGLPYAETVCVSCGRDNDSVVGEMCVSCVRLQDEERW